jgi:Ran GTPase-activating protein (RanGAP) involved in mRNA processing and transport
MDKPYNFITVYLRETPTSGSHRIKFATNFVDQQDEKFVIDLDVLEVALLDGRGSIITRLSDDMVDDNLKKQIKFALNGALIGKLDTGIKDAADFDLNVDFKL